MMRYLLRQVLGRKCLVAVVVATPFISARCFSRSVQRIRRPNPSQCFCSEVDSARLFQLVTWIVSLLTLLPPNPFLLVATPLDGINI